MRPHSSIIIMPIFFCIRQWQWQCQWHANAPPPCNGPPPLNSANLWPNASCKPVTGLRVVLEYSWPGTYLGDVEYVSIPKVWNVYSSTRVPE